MTNKEENKQIAAEIIRQLGGNRFIAMVGAKQLSFGDRELHFRIGRNPKSINCVVVKLNHMDTYNVQFLKIRKATVTTVEEFEGIYCDQLETLFSEVTGLATRL